MMLRDSRCIDNTYWNIRSKLVYSEANNVYMYIYKKLRYAKGKHLVSVNIYIYTFDSSKHHDMNMQASGSASGSASGIRRKNFYTWSNLNLVARAMVR